MHWLYLTAKFTRVAQSCSPVGSDICLYFYPTVSACNNFLLCLCFSPRFSQPVHQQRVAAVVRRARGSSWVSVWAAVAAGRVCNCRVLPVLCLPLRALLLGSFSRSRSGGQHWWVQRVHCEMKESLEIHCSDAATAEAPRVCRLVILFAGGFLVFLWVII